MSDDYAPARPIMGRDELAAHQVTAHGRDYSVSDDGYDDIEAAKEAGWASLSSWGRDGWDLGNWPYVSIQVRKQGDKFGLQQIVEGDHDVYEFDTQGDLFAAIDYLFLWYAADEDWAPLAPRDRNALDAGGFIVPLKFRGPYRAG